MFEKISKPISCKNLQSLQIEDEEHFILFCKKHDSIRKNLFSKLNIDETPLTANSEINES
jgi:uncharacterized membrane protein YvbJ